MKKLFICIVLSALLAVPAFAADTKVSALTELAAAPAESDELYINDGGTSKKITVLNLMGSLEAALTDYEIHIDNLPTIPLASLATTVTITDNESTDETNAILFTPGGDLDGGNLGPESDGDLTYNPSSGIFTAPLLSSGAGDFAVDADGDVTAKSYTTPKVDGVAGFASLREANSTDTDYIGTMGPASLASSWSYQYSGTAPTAGQIMVYAAPAGTGDPNSNPVSAQTWISESDIRTLDDNESLQIDATPDGMDDGEYNGVTIKGIAHGETVGALKCVFLASDGKVDIADADAAGEFPAFGLTVNGGDDTDAAIILVRGVVRDEDWTGLTVGGAVYLGDGGAGAITQTAPSTSGDCVQIVGWALSDSEIYFDFSRPYVTLQ